MCPQQCFRCRPLISTTPPDARRAGVPPPFDATGRQASRPAPRSPRTSRVAQRLFALMLIAASAPASAADGKPDLARIRGKIQFVTSFPDYKVKLVDSFADLHVKIVEHFPDDPGEWQIVEHFPDYRIQIVESFPDFTIRYVEHFPGLP